MNPTPFDPYRLVGIAYEWVTLSQDVYIIKEVDGPVIFVDTHGFKRFYTVDNVPQHLLTQLGWEMLKGSTSVRPGWKVNVSNPTASTVLCGSQPLSPA